jgi:hypothetical protein
VILALLISGCSITPKSHNTEPYRSDPERALALEQYAGEICAERRGGERLPPHPFTTDACSGWFDASWKQCCVEHDVHYWCGGSAEDRRRVDRELRACVSATTGGVLPAMMHAGVRIGGAQWQPTPWRWGYGWDYCGTYDREGDAPAKVESHSADRAE